MRTKDKLSRKDFIASKKNKELRKVAAVGHITMILGDDLFFVRHPGDKDPAVYLSEELAIEPGAFWKLTRQTEFGLFFKEFLTYDDIWEHVDIEDIERETVKVEGPFFEARMPNELREGVLETPDMFDILLEDD